MRGFQGMPPPWAWGYPPYMFGQQQQNPEILPEIVVPARVRQAMQFLELTMTKVLDRAAVSESQIQILEGKPLTPEEENTHTAALQLLGKYFDGRLTMDDWEKHRFEIAKKKAEMQGRTDGGVIRCVMCGGAPPHPQCQFCKGHGKLLVYPVVNGESLVSQEEGESPPEDGRASGSEE